MSRAELTRRELALAAAAVAGAGVIGGGAVWQRHRREAALAAFDPELRGFVHRFLDDPPPGLSDATLARFRGLERDAAPSPLSFPPVTRTAIAGLNGASLVGVDLINAQPGRARPAILYLHGGGFVMSHSGGAVRYLQSLAAALDCVAITVDYRLAPDTDHVGMIDDCSAALGWVHRHAATIGVDPARIAIMGASAGGGLAALLAMRARDEGVVRPCFQLLLYPMLDDRTGTPAGPPPPKAPLLWTINNNLFGWRAFLGPVPSRDAVPARRNDLAGLPPTFIAVGSLDLFLGEDVRFARALAMAGVPTAIEVVPGAFHGFDLAVPGSKAARRLRATIVAALGKAFAVAAGVRD